jgi:hypothetical protein
MCGHSDFELILSTYYFQNDDAHLVAEASRIDYGRMSPAPMGSRAWPEH